MNWVTLTLLWLFSAVSLAKKQCEPITIPLCKGIGYNMTSYPNSYGHEKQDEAGLEVHQFYPLVEVNCYKHLKFFLCGLYTPICQENYDITVLPCQEVCREAQKKCSPIMNSHGFQWPETLNCDRLPKFSEQEQTGKLCAAPPDATHSSAEVKESVPEVAVPKTKHSKHNQPEFSSKSIHNHVQNSCSCQCGRPFTPVSAETISRSGEGYHVQNVSNCAYSCSGLLSHHNPEEEVRYNQYNLGVILACLLLSFLTAFTIGCDRQRFPYPERPIFYISLCQLILSIGFLIQAYHGPQNKIGCDADMLRTMMTPEATVGNSSQWKCLTTFILTYYFGMASCVWWVVLALSWLLAAVPHWSTEWISKYAGYFHAAAWLLPAIQTGLAYFYHAIDGDPVSGICYVGNTNTTHLLYFVILPTAVYFVAGITCLFIGLQYLWSLRSNLQKSQHKTSKLSQLMSKIVIFALIYSASVVLHCMVLLYEYYNRAEWEQSLLCPCSNKAPVNANTLYLMSFLKNTCMMCVGWSSLIWIFSPKTLQSWRNLCRSSSPYATYKQAKLPFRADIHGSQYHQIPPPPPPLPHPQFPPRKYHSPDIIYAKHDLMSSPHFSVANTLRHCPRDL